MALIPAGAAAGGPVGASLSLCLFPVTKWWPRIQFMQNRGEKTGKHSSSVLVSCLHGHLRHPIMQLTCAVKTTCSNGAVSWQY